LVVSVLTAAQIGRDTDGLFDQADLPPAHAHHLVVPGPLTVHHPSYPRPPAAHGPRGVESPGS
jgi:hypothetical protein